MPNSKRLRAKLKSRTYNKRWRRKHPKTVKAYYKDNRAEILKQKKDYYQRKKLLIIEKAVERVMDIKDGFEKPEVRKLSGRTKGDYDRINRKLNARKVKNDNKSQCQTEIAITKS